MAKSVFDEAGGGVGVFIFEHFGKKENKHSKSAGMGHLKRWVEAIGEGKVGGEAGR